MTLGWGYCYFLGSTNGASEHANNTYIKYVANEVNKEMAAHLVKQMSLCVPDEDANIHVHINPLHNPMHPPPPAVANLLGTRSCKDLRATNKQHAPTETNRTNDNA